MMMEPRYTLEEIFTLKRAFPDRKWGTVRLMLVLAEANDEAMTMTHVAQRMRFSTAAATGLVEGAVALGLVARHAVPGDRRLVAIRLTAHGLALLAALSSQATAAA